ncbi:HNH endonuclease [Aquitalea sp.]|uniref:HNH endonuclease n=1 Tax=Aquitalea sp. TaxID=1872623 RepID=UPI002589AE97|nr:HNH endonuclease [Aquitalea sp.]
MDLTYEQAVNFYRRNYRGACAYHLSDDSEKIILVDAVKHRCRFCGRSAPDVSFRLVAHALPELLGNKKLFSRYECDTCNTFFGEGIENDYGNWSKPMRTLTGRKGKNGIPTHKGGGETGWRIERKNNHFYINAGEDEHNRPFVARENHRVIDFALKCDPYRPMSVHKAFVKMALSILPEAELPNFRQALAWIMNFDHLEEVPILAPVLVSFTPGPARIDGITVGVICRKEDAPDIAPYAFLILTYGHESFQVILPSPERDAAIEGEELILPPFPQQPSQDGLLQVFSHDLRDTELVTEAVVQCTFEFESAQISSSP